MKNNSKNLRQLFQYESKEFEDRGNMHQKIWRQRFQRERENIGKDAKIKNTQKELIIFSCLETTFGAQKKNMNKPG